MIAIRHLAATELSDLHAALVAADLRIDDLALPERRFLRFNVSGQTLGFGGLEGSGADLLLRSVVVVEPWRGRGLGQTIVRHLEAEARRIGAKRLHLLTTTAGPFFRGLGYDPADRASAPAIIAGTEQFTSLCPASADYLRKSLGVQAA